MYRILPCLYSCTGALLVAVSQEADKNSAWLLHLLRSSNVDQQPNFNNCSSVNLPVNQQQLQGQQQQQQQHQQQQQQQREGWQQTWQWQQQQQHQNWQKSWQWQQQQQQLKQQGWWRWPNVHACQGRLVAHLLLCPGTASLLLPCRQFSSSSAALGKRHTAAWPQQPPVLHQPAQHLTGAGPAQPLQNSHLIMQLPSTTSQRLADAGIDGSTSSSKSTFSSRLKAAAGSLQAYLQTGVQKLQPSLARAWPFVAFIILSMSGSYCIYLAPRYVMLLSAASLRSPDPVLQSQAIRRLSSVLWLYQQVTEMGSWPPAAGDLMEQWLLQALVMLVRPGADAGVLAELFAFLQRLLDYDRNVKKALRQAGMLAALNAGLQQGWLPRGALDAAKVLQRDLQ